MKLFADTANLGAIKEIKSWGILDGVTTNPTLLSAEGEKPEELLYQICELVGGPVSAEVISTDSDGMVKEGKELSKIHKNIVVKIPCTINGLTAVRKLKEEGIRTNMTLIFSPTQALLAAKAGADFASPFIGRLDDISSYGMELISDIITIYNNYGFDTEVLVASIRHPMHIVEASLLGADIVTIPPDVFRKIIKHPLTDIGLERFLADWRKIEK